MDFQLLIYTLVITNILFGIFVIILIFILLKNTKKSKYEGAKEEAEELLRNARKRSLEMIKGAEFFGEEAKEDLMEALLRVTEEYGNESKKVFDKAREDVSNVIKGILTDIKTDVEKDVVEVNETLKKSIGEGIKNVEVDLQSFKKERMALVENQIAETVKLRVNEIAEKVLGKSLTSDDHEKLIMDALDLAKNDNVL